MELSDYDKPDTGQCDGMPDLVDRLTDSRRSEPKRIEPRFSRKTNRVTVTVYVEELPVDASVSIKRLDKAIERACTLSDGYGPSQMLLDELLQARQKYGHIIDKKKKRRGFQAGREGLTYDMQYAAAWTYTFIRHQWERTAKDHHRLLQVAELRLLKRLQEEQLVHVWDTATRSWKIRLLTAFLVGNAYANERRNQGFFDPLLKFAKFNADSFYRTYIQPKLKHVQSRIAKKPSLLDSLSNAYLRELFYPRNPEGSLPTT